MGTQDGLNRYDGKNIVIYKSKPEKPESLGDNNVLSIHEDKSANLWIGTYGGGLSYFDRVKERFTNYRHDRKDTSSLTDDRIYTICEDRSANLWIGTQGGGLNRLHVGTDRFTRYKYSRNNPDSLSDNIINVVYVDHSGSVWVGTSNGLNLFDRSKGGFIVYKNNANDPASLSDNDVRCIHEDRSGSLWIGTRNGGLNKFDPANNKFIRSQYDPASGNFSKYTEEDGLPNNVVYGILEDEKATLWVSTNNGLAAFDPKSTRFRTYDVTDGLQSNEFNFGAYFKGRDGEMYFGGLNGFNVFCPANIKDNPYVPNVLITDLQIFNNSVPVGEWKDGRVVLEQSITETDFLYLAHKDNVFSFEFVALHYSIPERNEYAYFMEGFEKEWNIWNDGTCP